MLNPNNDIAYLNWGTALGRIGILKNDISALNEAIDKYKKAIAIDSNQPYAYNNWSSALLTIAANQTGDEKKRTMLDGLEKAKKAVEIGGTKYNLACAYALLSDKENALRLLNEVLEKKEATVASVLNDSDWGKYLEDSDFISLIANYSMADPWV